MMPKRIQRKRTKGWKMPEGAVYVGRPSKWGNPYRVCEAEGLFRETVLRDFKREIDDFGNWFPTDGTVTTSVEDVKRELRGKDLACWCRLDQPCHADVLLEIANAAQLGEES